VLRLTGWTHGAAILVGLLTLASVAGCGGSNLTVAPVSGTVTLNGQPLPNAFIMFEPIESGGTNTPTSNGRTDDKGHYVLSIPVTNDKGAVLGKHTVRILAAKIDKAPDDDSISKVEEPVPAKYNAKSELTFEVKAGGSDKADFALTK
jgi:hypothetical protein